MWPRPRILVSACLGFSAVRYDGGLIPSPIVEALKTHATLLPLCPEVEIGLGVPRPPIRLVVEGETRRLIQPSPTYKDLTEQMEHFAQRALNNLEVEGFILKNRSPSCALKDARLYGPKGNPLGKGPGLFGQAVLHRFPLLPAEDEGRLTNPLLRAQFLMRVFALARLRKTENLKDLQIFHAHYKLLLMAHNPQGTKALGNLLAKQHPRPFMELRREYEEGFLRMTLHPPKPGGMANALQHALGYFKEGLSSKEKAHFLTLIEEIRTRRRNPEPALALLRSWALRFDEVYVETQALLEPFPPELNAVVM